MGISNEGSALGMGRTELVVKLVIFAVASALTCWHPAAGALALPIAFFALLPTSWARLHETGGELPFDIRLGRFFAADEPGGLQGYAEYEPVAAAAGIVPWRREVQRMPAEFQSINPKLVMSETNIAGEVAGVPFFGTVDQVFEGKDGRLYIVDTKTHAKPTAPRAEEILQLSVYRALLVQKYGEDAVSREAFIRSLADGTDGLPLYRRVTLLPVPLVEEMARELKAVRCQAA